MATEIELKYLVDEQDVDTKITSLLTSSHFQFSQSVNSLSNCYFDTPDLQLRQKDIGLRVRQVNEAREQTIKMSGKVLAGLHQRPEFNVAITNNFPNLSLFPKDIWSEQDNVEELQSNLMGLFKTDFTRHAWLVDINDSQVELVFDKGEISVEDRLTKISEIEIELIKGDVNDLFILATHLFKTLALRPGIDSKAARGYRLFHNLTSSTSEVRLEQIITSKQTINDNFIEGVSDCLHKLQLAIARYVAQPTLIDLSHVLEILVTLRHGCWLFDVYVQDEVRDLRDELSYFIQLFAWVDGAINLEELMNKTGNYRKKLEKSQQLIELLRLENKRVPDPEHVIELLQSERFNLLQLSLLKMVIVEPQQYFTVIAEDINYRQLAIEKLNGSLNELLAALPDKKLTIEQFLAVRKLLRRSLLTGAWFSCLFEQSLRDLFRAPWLDILQGLSELQSLAIIHQQLALVEQPSQKLIDWQESKLDNLIHALEHSLSIAKRQVPYWQV